MFIMLPYRPGTAPGKVKKTYDPQPSPYSKFYNNPRYKTSFSPLIALGKFDLLYYGYMFTMRHHDIT
jgi:hypothetical protein